MERLRSADGTEQITFRSSAARPVRLPVEVRLGTDLAELGSVAVGLPGPELRAAVHGSGLRWSGNGGVHAVVSTTPSPEDSLASPGLLRWEIDLPPGGHRTIELRAALEYGTGGPGSPSGHHRYPVGVRIPGPRTGAFTPRTRGDRPPRPWAAARLECDDHRADALMASSLDDLHGLVMRDPIAAGDMYVAGGFPWRCGLAPAEALWAARMLLPLGTRLAAGTLRALARSQQAAPGADFGRIPGALRDAGPHSPPSCTGIEATLLFPAVLAEARRWGLPEQETERLLPAAERCLRWLRRVTDPPGGGRGGYVPDPVPGGPYRCETQAHAHRAALLGADLLDACGSSDAAALRDWAADCAYPVPQGLLAGGPLRAAARSPAHRRRPARPAPRLHHRPPPRHRPARRRHFGPRSAGRGTDRPAGRTAGQPGHGLRVGPARAERQGERLQPVRPPQRRGSRPRDGDRRRGPGRGRPRAGGRRPDQRRPRRRGQLRAPPPRDVRGRAAHRRRRPRPAPGGLPAGRRGGGRRGAHTVALAGPAPGRPRRDGVPAAARHRPARRDAAHRPERRGAAVRRTDQQTRHGDGGGRRRKACNWAREVLRACLSSGGRL